MDAALIVNQCLDEDLNLAAVEIQLAELARQFDGKVAPWVFLKQQGFGGEAGLDVVDGSRIDTVLKLKRGLPITLGALLVHLSEVAGRNACGINFPGRFLVRVDEHFIDPLSMAVRTEQQCLATLPAGIRSATSFDEADPLAVLLRMFNNLKYHYAESGEFHRALDMVDCQLQALPENPGLLLEQGEFWLRLGSAQSARSSFQVAHKAASASNYGADWSEVREIAKRRLTELADRKDTLH